MNNKEFSITFNFYNCGDILKHALKVIDQNSYLYLLSEEKISQNKYLFDMDKFFNENNMDDLFKDYNLSDFFYVFEKLKKLYGYIKFDNKIKLIEMFIKYTLDKMQRNHKDILCYCELFNKDGLREFLLLDEDSLNLLTDYLYKYFQSKGIIKKEKSSIAWKDIFKFCLINEEKNLKELTEEFKDKTLEPFIIHEFPYFMDPSFYSIYYVDNKKAHLTFSERNYRYELNCNILNFPFTYTTDDTPICELSKIKACDDSLSPYRFDDDNENITYFPHTLYGSSLGGTNKLIRKYLDKQDDDSIEEFFEFVYWNWKNRINSIYNGNTSLETDEGFKISSLCAKRVSLAGFYESRDQRELLRGTPTFTKIQFGLDFMLGFLRNLDLLPDPDVFNKYELLPKSENYKIEKLKQKRIATGEQKVDTDDYEIQCRIDFFKTYQKEESNFICMDKEIFERLYKNFLEYQEGNYNFYFYWFFRIKERILNEDYLNMQKIIYYFSRYKVLEVYNDVDINLVNLFFLYKDSFLDNINYKKAIMDSKMDDTSEVSTYIKYFDEDLRYIKEALK